VEPTVQDLLDVLALQREYGASLDEKRLDDHLTLYEPDAVLRDAVRGLSVSSTPPAPREGNPTPSPTRSQTPQDASGAA